MIRVIVGGGKLTDALQLTIIQPILWSILLGLSFNVTEISLPKTVLFFYI